MTGRMHCGLCDQWMPLDEALHHLNVLHPDDYDDGPDVWPDGQVVVVDLTLEPRDFR